MVVPTTTKSEFPQNLLAIHTVACKSQHRLAVDAVNLEHKGKSLTATATNGVIAVRATVENGVDENWSALVNADVAKRLAGIKATTGKVEIERPSDTQASSLTITKVRGRSF